MQARLSSQVDIVSRGGEKIPVSVWMKRVQRERLCCVVVLEPVERVSAWVTFQSDVSVPAVSLPCVAAPWARLPELQLTLGPAVCLWGDGRLPCRTPHCAHVGKQSYLPVPQFPHV